LRQISSAVAWDALIEIGWPSFDPIDNFGIFWMLPQRVD
jgi:hypothetical protein